MANYSGVHVVTATSASVGADLVVLTGAGASIRVTNVTGASAISFTVSRPGGACPVPTVGGVNNYIVAAVAGASTNVRHDGQFGSVVQLISAAATEYTVEVQSLRATS